MLNHSQPCSLQHLRQTLLVTTRCRAARPTLRQPFDRRRCYMLGSDLKSRRRSCLLAGSSSGPTGDVEVEEGKATAEERPRSSGVAAALADAEAAVQDGTFNIENLETLMPEAMKEVEALLAKAEAAELAQAQAEEKAQASDERHLRLTADFDNFRKRSAAEKEQLGDKNRAEVIKALIPLADSFEAAQISVKAETENEKKINGAYQGLYKQMVETFKSLGVEAVPGVGEAFDPEFHDAIMREPSNEVPDGTVLQEFRRGFRLGKLLLRPGMVKVSYSDEPAASANGSEEEAAEKEDVIIDVEAN